MSVSKIDVLRICDCGIQFQGGEEKSAVEGEAAEGGDAADTLSDLRDDDEDSVSALLRFPGPPPRRSLATA